MGIEQYRDRVSARVKQAITQSGVDLSTVSADAQDRLASAVTDGMLFEFDAILDSMETESKAQQAAASAKAAPAVAPDVASATETIADEPVLWEDRPFISIGERYVLTNDRIRIFNGLVGRTVENIELIRLQDIDYHQGISERIFGIGDITLTSRDATDPIVILRNIKDPEKVANLIRAAWLEARKRHGLVFRDIV